MPPRPRTVLVVTDDRQLRDSLAARLRRDHRVLAAESGEEALARLQQEEVDVLLVDAALPGISGLEVLRIVRENFALVEVIMISATSDVELAVTAMKEGAFHFVTKGHDPMALRSLVRRACERRELNRQLLAFSTQAAEQDAAETLVGASAAMRQIVELVQKVAKLQTTVLITGESGTGKELIARMLHRESDRAAGPFVAVNLAAIPHELVESTLFGHEKGAFTGAHRQQLGKFELASSGTLFLDEIGDLRLDLQAKLLRAIQEGEIERVGGSHPIRTDFRLIVATNTDLEQAVKQGAFREDLYYRINVVPIRVPPLRERIEDVPVLARHFLEYYRAKFRKPIEGIAESTLELLASYWWPGNVRELRNVVERMVAVCDKAWITDEDLPLEYHVAQLDRAATNGNLYQQACDAFERNFLIRSLERCGWNVTATARYLGLPLSTLKHKMARLEIRELTRRIRRS
ncbi:MAG TPA: sigma-54 dependent transcriptional regulator [Vicinamibacterales bacterium]|nr:sigma-54 dependent transcriptional regulator [Vicinamibacterales bacterium]